MSEPQHVDDGAGAEPSVREQDKYLPTANIARIMKKVSARIPIHSHVYEWVYIYLYLRPCFM